ncbi:hypothetical protein SAMD00019534_091980 [Acytostelium subglobosum LB1]|uniref:hypothetical protein n=1 Tax=Acytostelium subglobosum LB1 TaxID=1410327 RepID=UPI0006448059|nr:hypothetical protein SAMD00019534_091980 [Acytostelium subglobosum LB1]GAM26023.1 hypothetical protein SAMD00019534_091980 [Acytostelium subglobosum LB1]|eukprot:XP_012751066.1 hypothetical protein SAMD00019534_091980 [Acytostelium subglobosum LB1]
MKFSLFICIILSLALAANAFNINSGNNFVGYWGQNSAAPGGRPYQTELGTYCTDNTYDVLIVSFLINFFSGENIIGTNIPAPTLNFANMCGGTYPGYSQLLQCPNIGSGAATCQSKGKIVLLSLGGAVGNYGFTSSAQATQFAKTIWNMFLGGSDSTYPRPFGSVQLDGIDLDLEGGPKEYYDVFVNTLKIQYFAGASKRYYIHAAPQCVYPDAMVGPWTGSALSTGKLDFISIQFYNNWCGLASGSQFNYNTWSQWISANSPGTKIMTARPTTASSTTTPATTSSTSTTRPSTTTTTTTRTSTTTTTTTAPATTSSTTSTTVKPTTTTTTTAPATTSSTTSSTTVKPTTTTTTTTPATTSSTTVKPTTTTTTGPSTTTSATTSSSTTSPNTLVFTQSVTSQWGSNPPTSQISGQVKNNGATTISNPKFSSPQNAIINGMWGLSQDANGYWVLPSWANTLAPGQGVEFGYAINSATPATFNRVA